MQDIFLSISIPSFNRGSKLKNLLDRMDALISDLPASDINKVELLVSDNHSSDNTSEVLKEFKAHTRSYTFRNYRNDENIGSDRNFVKSIQRASGIFVWLLSDDDIIENGAVAEIMATLKNNPEVGCGFINYFLNDNKTMSAIPMANDPLIVPNIESYVEEVMFADSMVSSFIVKKSLLTDKQLKSHMGDGFPFLYWTSAIQLEHSSAIIRKPLITFLHPGVFESRTASKNREQTRDFYFEAHLGFMKYTSYLKTLLSSNKLKKKIQRRNLDENFNQIIFHKITSKKYDFVSISLALPLMIRKFYFNPSFWLGHIPLLIGPSILARFLEPHRWRWLSQRAKIKVAAQNIFKLN
jgi:glycosyltransferase involved in cell wall biosynthesis